MLYGFGLKGFGGVLQIFDKGSIWVLEEVL